MKAKALDAQGGGDPVLTRAVAEDKVPWYKKPNLRYLYLFLFPTCMYVCVDAIGRGSPAADMKKGYRDHQRLRQPNDQCRPDC